MGWRSATGSHPGTSVTGNRAFARVLDFSNPFTTSRVRLNVTDPGTAPRVRELCLFDQPAPLFYELTGDAFPYGFPTTVNVALGKPVSVVQSNPTSGQPSYATDGEISDTSRYVAQPSAGPLAVEVNLTFPATLLEAHVYSGFQSGGADAAFHLEFYDGSSLANHPRQRLDGKCRTRPPRYLRPPRSPPATCAMSQMDSAPAALPG